MRRSIFRSHSKLAGTWSLLVRGPCLALALAHLSAADEARDSAKIWLNHFQLGKLASADDGDWPISRGGIETAFFAINTLWPMEKPMRLSIPPGQAAAAAGNLKKNGIRIGVECGYFDHPTKLKQPGNPASDVTAAREDPQLVTGVGELTARVEIAKIRSLWLAGHDPDYLVLDDPMRRLTVPGQDKLGQIVQGMSDYPSAAAEVISYMRVMKEKFPAVKFVVILNFPNWGWKGQPAFSMAPGRDGPMNWGDAHVAMEALFSALKNSGLAIHALQGDFPWRYFAEQPPDAVAATVDWPGRILQLEQYARDKQVAFHLTANSETGYVSAKAFSEDSLKYLDAYLSAGGKPDRFVVQSWYPHPVELLPEHEPYTGTWLAARFIQRLHEIRAGRPVAADLRTPRPFDRTEPEALLHLLERIDPPAWIKLAPVMMGEWLENENEPPASLASKHLRTLREAAASAIAGKPGATVVLRDNDAQTALGMAPLPVPEGDSQTWIVEMVCGSGKSELVTVWADSSKTEPMKPVWISAGSSRCLAVAVDPAHVKNGAVVLCVGTPGGELRKVSVPIQP